MKNKLQLTYSNGGNALPNALHNPAPLMSQHTGEQPLGVVAPKGVRVGVANPSSQDLGKQINELVF